MHSNNSASQKTYVIKLGGSMVSTQTETFDFNFLSRFAKVIRPLVKEGYQFAIVLGGGQTMRNYRDMARQAGIEENLQLHWIGTTVNVLHAEICRAYFSDISNERPVIYEDYYDAEPLQFDKPIIWGGGGRPGHSGDIDALLLAKKLDIKRIISLKNIDGVYSADPKIDGGAQLVEKLNWDEYLEIIGNKQVHKPGASFPVDPVASKQAKKLDKEFAILAGEDLENFENMLKLREFKGSIISDEA